MDSSVKLMVSDCLHVAVSVCVVDFEWNEGVSIEKVAIRRDNA